MRKCSLEQLSQEVLHVRHVVYDVSDGWRQQHGDLVRLDQREHVGEDGSVHREAGRM